MRRRAPRALSAFPAGIAARIVAVVDFFDALTMDRCYRPAFADEKALAMLAAERGCAFDPRIVDTFLAHADELIATRDHVTTQKLGFEGLSGVEDPGLRAPA